MSRAIGWARPSAHSKQPRQIAALGRARPSSTASSSRLAGQRLLGEPGVDPDAKLTERQLDKREPPDTVPRWCNFLATPAAHPASSELQLLDRLGNL